MILNRLKKNLKKRQAWTKQANVQAFRLYDKDIPEYPFLVDVYGDYFVIYDKGRKDDEKDQAKLEELIEVVSNDLARNAGQVIVKSRHRQRNRQQENSQYDKLADENLEFSVQEGDCQYLVNLSDYLDTGLFLDHRPLRTKIKKICHNFQKSQGASPSFLNLFCYTGAVSVAAAKAGAQTTSVDMSNTYIAWAQKNFELNQLPLDQHHFLREDVLKYLSQRPQQKYDMIYCDPPTFSNSKKMKETFEIEREQLFIIGACMDRLRPDGTLYFSTNKRNFKLDEQVAKQWHVTVTTAQSIPKDFHDQKIHQSFEIKRPSHEGP